MPERPHLTLVSDRRSERPTRSYTDADAGLRAGRGGPRRRPDPPSSSLARALVLVVVALGGAVALAPRLVKGDLPVDPALLGTPARGVVRADRDYALVDVAATEELRRKAGERSLTVWDLDEERPRTAVAAVQKALVRIAVALEAARKAHDMPARGAGSELPASVRATLDPVRAVVAGELASAGLDAPQDEAWRALLGIVWGQPAAVDAIVAVLGEELTRPIVPPGLRAGQDAPGSGEILVRGLGRARDERVIDSREVVDEGMAREHLRARLQTALAAAAPSSSTAWAAATTAVAGWLSTLARPTLTWNAAESDARRRSAAERVPPTVVRAHRGEIVLRPGEIITARHQLLARAMAVQQADDLRTRATVGTAFFIGLLCVVVYLFGARRVFQRRLRTRDVVFLGCLLLLELAFLVAADAVAPLVAIALPGTQPAVVAFAIPAAFGPMCARVTLPPDVALLLALVGALLGGVVVEAGMVWAVVAVLSSMTGAAIVTNGPRRLTTLLAGLGAGTVGVFAALTLELFRGALAGSELLGLLGATLAGGVLSGVLAVAIVPVVEVVFGYVTDQRLYRLADLSHPLLKDLIVHAPGTWHHSVRAAVLAERAAVAVGANPLLARVMALYHDIGKIAAPQSFRENQHGDNPHDRLSPEESAAVLRGHVEEGLALARQHHIPQAVADVIEEHHGDSVMEVFLEKAHARARDAGLSPSSVDERVFRYAGRAPRSRESALVMLADQIESAARTLEDPTPGRLGEVVDAFVNRALAADTLAACDLSLRDLGRARAALKDALRELSRAGPERRADPFPSSPP